MQRSVKNLFSYCKGKRYRFHSISPYGRYRSNSDIVHIIHARTSAERLRKVANCSGISIPFVSAVISKRDLVALPTTIHQGTLNAPKRLSVRDCCRPLERFASCNGWLREPIDALSECEGTRTRSRFSRDGVV